MTVHRPDLAREAAATMRPHAVVIGAGFGGLAAAIRLGARGYRVTVLEALDQPGGRARQFRQDGFRFDAGPTIVTAPFLFEELWTLCGKRMADDVTLRRLDPCYTIRFADGSSLRCHADHDAMRRAVADFAPEDLEGYDRLLRESKACYDAGFEAMAAEPFHTLRSFVRALPDMVMRRADRSVYGLVARHVRDERLRMALSFHPLFVGGNPFRSSAVLSLINHLEQRHGIHYAMGGTYALVAGLVDLIEGQGGTLLLNAPVAQINERDGAACGVTLADGTAIPADLVVSNADAASTYNGLLSAHRRRRWTDSKLARLKQSMSLFVWYFGTDRRFEDVDHHTIMMGPRYRDLLEDIFEHKVLAEDFSLYLHRPTATDRGVAPDGCDAFYVLSPVPNLEAGIDWSAETERYRRRIARFLDATVLPGFEEQIVTQHVMTPTHFRDELGAFQGAAFAMEPRLFQLAWFRPHNRSEELRNLYVVGAGTHPGAGMPGVLCSAKILDKVVPHADAIA